MKDKEKIEIVFQARQHGFKSRHTYEKPYPWFVSKEKERFRWIFWLIEYIDFWKESCNDFVPYDVEQLFKDAMDENR